MLKIMRKILLWKSFFFLKILTAANGAEEKGRNKSQKKCYQTA